MARERLNYKLQVHVPESIARLVSSAAEEQLLTESDIVRQALVWYLRAARGNDQAVA